MADKKLSALTDADTPLAGDELIYVVQDGNSRKVATGSLYIPGGTDVAVSDGGTGASNASDARDNLGLTIGVHVQAYSATLDAIAQVSPESYGLGLLEMPDAASAQVYLDLAPVAASGDYDDLDNKPTLGTMAAEDASNYTPTSGLAAVALSNDYTDLDNLPSLAPIATSGDFDDLTNVPTNVADLADLTPGTDGQVVGWQSGELATFTASGSGDMLASMYDPNGVEADAFDSANHAYDNTGSGLSATNVQDAIDKIASVANSAVLFEAQTLNATQQAQVRANIAAVGYEEQSLSPAEQGQARTNIGVGHTFNTVAELLADETMSYTSGAGLIEVGPGDIIEAQGFRYEVAASDAVDAHIETAGGVKLYVLGPVPDVTAFGAHGDARALYPNATIANGSASLQISSNSFSVSDVGKVIMVGGAGTGGTPLVTTIVSYTSPTTVILADSASTALSDTRTNITFGYDDTEAFQKCAAAFLKWRIPRGNYILSDTVVLRADANVFGEGRRNTNIYRVMDAPIFKLANAGTDRTQSLQWGGVYCYGRGKTDTAPILDFRGLSYAQLEDYQIIGDPLGSGGVSLANCKGLDLTLGDALFNGYIKLKDGFIWYCDVGLDADVNQLEIEGGFLNANKTWGGKLSVTNLKIINTEVGSNGRGQTASYVGTYPNGHYDKGGLLLDGCIGVSIEGVWHEFNAQRAGGLFAANDIDVMSNCKRVFIQADRRNQDETLRVHGLGLDTGSYAGSGLSPQSHAFTNLLKNGRMERLLASGVPDGWTDAGTITSAATELLPPGVVGLKMTGTTGVSRRYQTIIPAADIPKYIGKRITASFWLAVHDEDWSGGHVRVGFSLNGGSAMSNGAYVALGPTISGAGTPTRATVSWDIDGSESNGIVFAAQFFRTTGPWSIELGDISVAIGDVVPASFERAINTGDYLNGSTTWNPGSLAAGASEIGPAITVPGAELGDFVIAVSFSLDADGCDFTGYVSATNTVIPIVTNKNAGTKDLGNGTVRVRVMKR